MRTAGAMSIAALVAASTVTPRIELDAIGTAIRKQQQDRRTTSVGPGRASNDNGAVSAIADVRADDSVDAYEG